MLADLQIYSGDPLEIPRESWDGWPFVAAAATLLFGPALVAFIAVAAQPDLAYGIVPLADIRLIHLHKLWTDIPQEQRAGVSGVILTHNITVAILAFAGGILFTLPTIYLLVFNGISFGAVFGLAQDYGMSGGLGEFVVGHGVLELSIIVASGAAGLKMGWSLISPGRYSRRDALFLAARDAFTILMGLAPVLVIAGIIEGNISPSDIAWPLHVAVGIGSGVLLYWYLLFTGRTERRSVSR